jgi:hypothetical protein
MANISMLFYVHFDVISSEILLCALYSTFILFLPYMTTSKLICARVLYQLEVRDFFHIVSGRIDLQSGIKYLGSLG